MGTAAGCTRISPMQVVQHSTRGLAPSWCGDERVPEFLALPFETSRVWEIISGAWADFEERAKLLHAADAFAQDSKAMSLSQMMALYCHDADALVGWSGLSRMFQQYPDTRGTFLARIVPFMITQARALPERVGQRQGPGSSRGKLQGNDAACRLRMLKYDRKTDTQQVVLDRTLVLSLLANAFLGTLAPSYSKGVPLARVRYDRSLPDPRFLRLLNAVDPAEVAKLRMFVNYFERTCQELPQGTITIYRHRSNMCSDESWSSSPIPLLPMVVEKVGVGFEDTPNKHLVHADFANMIIGGGVLTGGSVQEEISFAICPENVVALLLCPNMRDDEALQIVGAERFSKYSGYGSQLRYAGGHSDMTPRGPDGTVLAAIVAMDALDFRGSSAVDLSKQLEQALMLREANKAFAAFFPCSECTGSMPIATGNWGSGVFLGCAELKALLQWAAGSQAKRELVYFPFDQDKVQFSVGLQELSDACTGSKPGARSVRVGDLWKALQALRTQRVSSRRLFKEVLREIGGS